MRHSTSFICSVPLRAVDGTTVAVLNALKIVILTRTTVESDMDRLKGVDGRGSGDNDHEEMNCLSLGFLPRAFDHKDPDSPTGIIDAFVPGYERDKKLEEMNPDSLKLSTVSENDLDFDCDDLSFAADTILPDFRSDISIRDHGECNVPLFEPIPTNTADVHTDEELELSQKNPDSSPPEMGMVSTPSGPYRHYQVPLLPYRKKSNSLEDYSLACHFARLDPLNPVLIPLRLFPDSPSRDTLFDSEDSISDLFQQKDITGINSAFQQWDSKARQNLIRSSYPLIHDFVDPPSTRKRGFDSPANGTSLKVSPYIFKKSHVHAAAKRPTNSDVDDECDAMHALKKSVHEAEHPSPTHFSPLYRDCVSQKKEISLEEPPCSSKRAHGHTVAEETTDSDVNGGWDKTNACKKGDDTVIEAKHSSTCRFSPPDSDPIYITFNEVTYKDVFVGQHERGSSHPGNVKYRKLVADNSPTYQKYLSKERRNKTKMRDDIILKIAGRFLDRDVASGLFCVLTREKVNAKVSQALRDGKKTNKNIARKRKPNKKLMMHSCVRRIR